MGRPGYKEKIPDGYIEVKSSFRPGFAFRSLPTPDGTPADAVALGKKLKMYYLSESPNPKPTKFIDPLNIRWSTLPRYDEKWFEDLYDIVNVEDPYLGQKALPDVPILRRRGRIHG